MISRPRWRRTCECASSPMEVSAPPVPRLFVRTPYGISFWARFLFEHCACFRPVHRVAAWFSSHGLAVSPGTLANSRKRFAALFETLYEAILAHQNDAALRHVDETSWRVQELRGEERSSRAWLWTSVSADSVCFHIDASRSTEAGLKLFAEARSDTVIVCDRYSAHKRLVRLLGDKMILSFCWSHARRVPSRVREGGAPLGARGPGPCPVPLAPGRARAHRPRTATRRAAHQGGDRRRLRFTGREDVVAAASEEVVRALDGPQRALERVLRGGVSIGTSSVAHADVLTSLVAPHRSRPFPSALHQGSGRW